MLHKAWNSKGEMPYCFPRSSIKFQGHTGQNITDFDPNWAFPDYRPVTAFKSLRFALFNTDYDEKRYSWYLFVVLIFKMMPVHWQRCFILTDLEWMMILRNFFCDKIFCDKNVSLVGGCQPRTLGFMPNALPFEMDSDLSLCQTE